MCKIEMEQSGGNSVQIGQVIDSTINILGVTEERAGEIFDERLQYLLLSYSAEGHAIAKERNNHFMHKFIDSLVKENLLDSLAEPSIQIALMEAQKIAASSEEETDYQILSDILLQRIKSNENRTVRANVSYAIGVVDKLSAEALLGLTLIYAIKTIHPKNGRIADGLDELDANLATLVGDRELPDDNFLEWLYVLEMLNLVHFRAGTAGTDFLADMLSNMLPGYRAGGIQFDSNKYLSACDKLASVSIGEDLLIPHEFNAGFARLPITYYGDVERLTYRSALLNEEQKKVVLGVFNSYTDDLSSDEVDSDEGKRIWDKFTVEFLKRPMLSKIQNWGDSFPYDIECTLVGCLLGYTNAKFYLPLSPYDGAFGECFNDA